MLEIASLKGINAAMITAVGKDEEGEEIRATASKNVILLCQTNGHTTGYAIVKHNKKKTPTFETAKNVAEMLLKSTLLTQQDVDMHLLQELCMLLPMILMMNNFLNVL